MRVTKQVTLEWSYNEFKVGDIVVPSSRRSVLDPVPHVVRQYIPPYDYPENGTIFVEGYRYGVTAEYVREATPEEIAAGKVLPLC